MNTDAVKKVTFMYLCYQHAGHAAAVGEVRNAYGILVIKRAGWRLLWKFRRRQEYPFQRGS